MRPIRCLLSSKAPRSGGHGGHSARPPSSPTHLTGRELCSSLLGALDARVWVRHRE
eukprot:CAMPEP_0183364704 /NCGR_PEP_ID=MMETSP0164_2-20130417/81486_1 /TAXON_ID=221442 /ORGANISM="Coccolithus pelagicus ssp braarudi, Strain PLY182g" /LENGTH=55 /DNA_ID=CAMNT_0025540061 /DNA_START=1 /DNA_END=165 /DNA_ORIENTATION=-